MQEFHFKKFGDTFYPTSDVSNIFNFVKPFFFIQISVLSLQIMLFFTFVYAFFLLLHPFVSLKSSINTAEAIHQTMLTF